jgi:hypothetical protein
MVQGGTRQQKNKLFPAISRRQIVRAQLTPENRGGSGEHPVAGHVAVLIVDGFEVVQICQNHAEAPSVPFRASQLAPPGLMKSAAIGKAGQHIRAGEALDRSLGLLKLAIDPGSLAGHQA